MSRRAYHRKYATKAGRKVTKHEPSLTRTKGLLHAALHLWEIKNGYRPDPSFNFGRPVWK